MTPKGPQQATDGGAENPEGWDATFDTLRRAQAGGDLDLLNEAIEAFSQIIDRVGVSHPHRVRILNCVSQALRQRFDLCGDRDDLDAAIATARTALELAAPHHPWRPVVMTNLSVLRQSEFIHYGVWKGLAEAEKLAQAAASQTDVDHPRWPDRVHAVSAAQRLLYEATGSPRHLDRANANARKAFAAADDERPYLSSHLALILRMQYERTGNLADLNEAVDLGRWAASSSDAIHSPMTWGNISTTLEARYSHVGDSDDLQEAIGWARRAVASTTAGHTHHAMFLSMLSGALRTRAEATRSSSDLDEAVEAAEQAVAVTDTSGPSHPGRLALLSVVLRARAAVNDSSSDLDRAVQAAVQAVATAHDAHVTQPDILHNAAQALWQRSQRNTAGGDRFEAIRCAKRALEATDQSDPRRTSIHLILGDALAGDDVESAVGHYRAGALQLGAPPYLRCMAARRWGRTLAAAGEMSRGTEGYRTAVELLPLLASRALQRTDQERRLERQTGLAGEAAATAIRDQRPDIALSLLEHGRTVMLAQILETRNDLTALRRRDPGLADRMSDLAAYLNAPETSAETASRLLSVRTGAPPRAPQLSDMRHRLTEEWHRHVTAIRTWPGFEQFLAPPVVTDLAGIADGGAVIALNVSEFGCDALVLRPGEPVGSLPLPKLNPGELAARTQQFTSAVSDRGGDGRQLLHVLDWLWRSVAEPVLAQLGIDAPLGQDAPRQRLWWMPTGLLTALPLHAAGAYDEGQPVPGHSVLDRVVSSYTPTLRSLHDARHRSEWRWPPRRPTVIAIPEALGQPPLLDAMVEAETVAAALSAPPPFPSGKSGAAADASRRCRELIADSDWAHLVCHAFNDVSSPSRSHLLLPDGGTLSIPEIAALSPEDPYLAYVSACATAYGGEKLTDEAVHLSSAFQLAGYTHVIGTLWHIHDAPAAEFARVMYGMLPQIRDVAAATHSATLTMRERYLEAPDIWASHVHIGP